MNSVRRQLPVPNLVDPSGVVHCMMPEAFYRFDVGSYRFLALDAFASDTPKVFDLSSEQLDWLRHELELARATQKRSVLFLHCYPSELGEFSSPLCDLIKRYGVLLVDMGHTHYNEIANDGLTLYTATRSTGQIEEGPVGFSVTNLDNAVVTCRLLSWLEELDWIPVGIFYLDLAAAGTSLHLIAKLHPRVLQRVDLRPQIRHAQDDSIPSARLLGFAAGHRTRSRCSWPTEQQHAISERHTRKRGKLLMFQPEAEMVRVEGRRPRDIRQLIAHAVYAEDARWLFTAGVIGAGGHSSLFLVHHTLLS